MKKLNIRFNDKTGRWEYSAYYSGKRKHFSSKEKVKRKAEIDINNKYQEWVDIVDGNTIKKRVKDVWEIFHKDYKSKNKISSSDSHQYFYNHITHLGNFYISEVTKIQWQDCIYRAFKNGVKSRKRLSGIQSVITSMCKFATFRGWLEDSQVPLYFDIPSTATKPNTDILQPRNLKLFLSDNYPYPPNITEYQKMKINWYMPVWRFLLYMGYRRGEVCAFITERDFINGRLTVRENIDHFNRVIKGGKTKFSEKPKTLGFKALEELERHRLMRAEAGITSPYLFCNWKGERIQPKDLYATWVIFRPAIGTTRTLHDLRRTFISFARNKAGLSLDDVKNLVGHSKSMDTDGVYVRDIELSPEEYQAMIEAEAEVASRIENIIFDNKK